jgi:hypothetical protein
MEPTKDMTAVLRGVIADLTAHPAAYLMAGVGYLASALVLVTLAVGLLGICMAPGIVKEDEDLLVIGGLVGMIPYLGLIFAFAFIAFPLMSASLRRALDAQRSGGEPIGFFSLFSGSGERTWPIVTFYVMSQVLVMVGMLMLYVPGIIAMVVTTFALPIVVLEDVAPVDALKIAWEHVRRNAAWHVGVWLLLIPAFIALELTIVGLLFIFPLLIAYQLVAYREAFGDKGALTWSAAHGQG